MDNKMNAAAITGINQINLVQVKRPEPGPNEILLRIHACALCTWEQRVFSGVKRLPLPHIGGHEIAGEIAGLGTGVDPTKFPLGAKAAGRTLRACGSCYNCRRGEHTQ